jgi:hypothetical protein
VYWDCLPGWEDTDNADDHCDWDKPYGAYDGLNWIY